jgi:hypothetical protein
MSGFNEAALAAFAAVFPTSLAGVPMTLGLGATTFVVFEGLFNRNIGIGAGITLAAVAFSFLYALGLILRIGHTGQMPPSEKQTLLKTKIEQLLTEARVIIPGAQALLGFQFVVVFVRSFAELPGWVKMTHAAALAAVALSVVSSRPPSPSLSVSPRTFAWWGSG